MGILGLQSAFEFSDRLFNSFDIDNDGKVFFLQFLDIFSRFSRIYGSFKSRLIKAQSSIII
jgi:Ca2+-binding EF-hand superfamily protein